MTWELQSAKKCYYGVYSQMTAAQSLNSQSILSLGIHLFIKLNASGKHTVNAR